MLRVSRWELLLASLALVLAVRDSVAGPGDWVDGATVVAFGLWALGLELLRAVPLHNRFAEWLRREVAKGRGT